MFWFDKDFPENVFIHNAMFFDDLFDSKFFFTSSVFSFTIDSTVVSFNVSVYKKNFLTVFPFTISYGT